MNLPSDSKDLERKASRELVCKQLWGPRYGIKLISVNNPFIYKGK